MEFLNLTLGQFLAVFGAVSAVSVALYLLDRTRRRQVVSTLRFWVEPGKAAPVTRRSRIQQPLSLLLQLLGMLLLILALAEFQFGGSRNARRDHVLVLDTSAWMGAGLPNREGAILMDLARASAIGWLRAVPTADRVLVVRADALATPATAWELDRRAVVRAILESQPGATALNLSQSLQFARQLQQSSGSLPGEIVYAGPGRISTRESTNMALPNIPAFRVLSIDDNIENSGLRSVGARHSTTDTGTWDVLVRARNYGTTAKLVNVTLNFGNIPQGSRPIMLAPGMEQEVTFNVHTRAAGILEARLYPKDAFGADNYAALELPEFRSLQVIVYSDQPEALRPALASDARVAADFRKTAQYTPDAGNNSLVILHHFRPPVLPHANVLWIDPPADKPPVAITSRVEHPEGLAWTPDQPLTAGLRARDVQIESASVFAPSPKDIRLAEVNSGPVMVANVADDGRTRSVVMGFDPFAGAMRYELTTPLLLANILRWVAPDVFRDVDVGTQSAGAIAVPIQSRDQGAVEVMTEAGARLPYNVRDRSVQFFAGEAARVRVIAGNSERVFSLTLPEMWDVKWKPPANVRHGIPAWNDALRRNRDWWPWLAALGAAILIGEWVAYGRYSPLRLRVVKPTLERAA
jgi:Aerotolerance regulator N-terminal